MIRLQTTLEEERCKVLQIDSRLEEIIETAPYFVDRSQDVLEVLNARMARLESNAENPTELPAKDHQALKRDHDLVEFAASTTEDFKKAVKGHKEHVQNTLEGSLTHTIGVRQRLNRGLRSSQTIKPLWKYCRVDIRIHRPERNRSRPLMT